MAKIITTSNRKKSKNVISLIAFSVLVLAIVGYFFFRPNSNVPIETMKPIATAPVKIVNGATEILTPSTSATIQVEVVAQNRQSEITNTFIKAPGTLMLPDGKILKFKPPAEGQTKKVVSNGIVYECDSDGNIKDITPPKCFDDPFEERLVGLSIVDGYFVPGFLKGYDQNDVIQVLKRPVVINDDDPEDVKVKKLAVAEMKEQILEYIEQGGTFDQFVDEMAAWSQQERLIKRKGIHRIIQLVNAGKVDEAKKFKSDIDNTLEALQFSPITLPKAVHEAVYGKQDN